MVPEALNRALDPRRAVQGHVRPTRQTVNQWETNSIWIYKLCSEQLDKVQYHKTI